MVRRLSGRRAGRSAMRDAGMRPNATNDLSLGLPRHSAPTRRRVRRLLWGSLAAAVAAWVAWTCLHGWTSARLERLIRAEVPPGCGRAEVEGFLDRHRILHGYVPGMEPGG